MTVGTFHTLVMTLLVKQPREFTGKQHLWFLHRRIERSEPRYWSYRSVLKRFDSRRRTFQANKQSARNVRPLQDWMTSSQLSL